MSACVGCEKCSCCVQGSPKATSSISGSACNGKCDGGTWRGTEDPDNVGCTDACQIFIGVANSKRGCTSPYATNRDPDATEDDNSCIIPGCKEKCADNYDPSVTESNNSCKYSPKCTDQKASNSISVDCVVKVAADNSKCDYTGNPNNGNSDSKPILITAADVCITQSSAKPLPVGGEVTFRSTYTYQGTKKIYLRMVRGTADCLKCDSPKQLTPGVDLQTYSQFVVQDGNDLGRKFLMRITTQNPSGAAGTDEQTTDKEVFLLDNIPTCESMVSGKYKQLGSATAPKQPEITKVALAAGMLSVTVKHSIREPSLASGTVLNDNEKVPDYYVVAYDDYQERSLYKKGDAVDWEAWYKAIAGGGKGTLKVFRPSKKNPEEESFAMPADNLKTYAIFVKAVNITWPYASAPPSTTPKVDALEGSQMAQTVFPTATSTVAITSKDRMMKATVTIPASVGNASFTLKSASQDMGTFDNLLGATGSQPYHIYNGEAEIFSDDENARSLTDEYINQKVIIVRDPLNSRKFDLYAVFNVLEPVTLSVSLDGVPGPQVVQPLTTDNTYDFARWIDFADEVISIPKPPVVVSAALAKTSAYAALSHPGLVARSLIQAYGYPFRMEISWVLGFYDGIRQGFTSDKEAAVGLVVFFKDYWTNASNLSNLIKQEATNFTFEKLKTAYEDVLQNLHDALHSEADRNIPFPGYEGTKWQVKFYMHGYLTGFMLEQVYVGMAAGKGFGYLGRGLAFGIQLSRSAILIEGLATIVKWRTAVVFFATRPLQGAADVAKDAIKKIHSMVDKLVDDIVPGSSESYGEKLSKYSDQGRKTEVLGDVTGADWEKARILQKKLVDLNERLVREGGAKLSETGAEGFERLHKHLVLINQDASVFLDDFIQAFEDANGKLKRDIFNGDLEEFVKLEIKDPDFISKVRLPPAILEEFKDGGSYLMTEELYERWVKGRPIIGYEDGQFMLSKKVMDQLIAETGGDLALLQQKIGTEGWVGKKMYRIDIINPTELNPRYPTPNLMGANSKFIFGGKTSGNLQEIVTDQIPASKFIATPL